MPRAAPWCADAAAVVQWLPTAAPLAADAADDVLRFQVSSCPSFSLLFLIDPGSRKI